TTDFAASSGSWLQTVGQGATTTQVSSAPNPSLFGQSVTVTATVAALAPASGIPSGNVTVLGGGTPIRPAVLDQGTATLTTAALTVGTHPLSVVYGGDFTFSASTSTAAQQVVTTAGSV